MSDFGIEAKDQSSWLGMGNGAELPGRIGGFKY
jgi:hypothetical protein